MSPPDWIMEKYLSYLANWRQHAFDAPTRQAILAPCRGRSTMGACSTKALGLCRTEVRRYVHLWVAALELPRWMEFSGALGIWL